jgi:hypothetical protein
MRRAETNVPLRVGYNKAFGLWLDQHHQDGEAGRATIIANADERAKALPGMIAQLEAEGHTSAYALARELNARSVASARGGKWTARAVLNATARLAGNAP